MAVIYKGIIKDSLEMGGELCFMRDAEGKHLPGSELDYKMMDRWRESKLPTEYSSKPIYDLNEESYESFI